MTVSTFGHLGVDPQAVPRLVALGQAAQARAGDRIAQRSFDRIFDAAEDTADRRARRELDRGITATPAAEIEPRAETSTPRREVVLPQDASSSALSADEAPTPAGVGAPVPTSIESSGDPGRTPSASTVPTSADAVEATSTAPARPTPTAIALPPNGSATSAGARATPSGTAPGPATVDTTSTGSQHARDARAVPSAGTLPPRTPSPATAALRPHLLRTAEQSRDSIFEQIALRWNGRAGELRLRLDPPELGRLDLQMKLDGGTMRLAIWADRPEVALMLERHVPELRTTLAEHGIDIADAEVHSGRRGDGDRPFATADERARPDGNDPYSDDDRTGARALFDLPASAGWLTGNGLDFWA